MSLVVDFQIAVFKVANEIAHRVRKVLNLRFTLGGSYGLASLSDLQATADRSGHLAVVWTQGDTAPSSSSYVQWFSATGEPVVGATRLDGSTGGSASSQSASAIASNSDGRFVAGWIDGSTVSARPLDFEWIPTTESSAPTLNPIDGQTLALHTPLSLLLQAVYPGGSPANVRITAAPQNPTGVTVELSTTTPGQATLHWSPAPDASPGLQLLNVDTWDVNNPALRTRTVIQVWYGVANQAPTLDSIANQTVTVGNTVTFTAVGHDPDGPSYDLRYHLGAGAPANAVLNPLTGVFSWTPTASDVSQHTLSIFVTDNGHPPQPSVSRNVIINVVAANVSPTITAPQSVQVNENATYTFGSSALSVADSDGSGAVMDLALSATNGRLTVANVSNLTFEVGSANQSASLVKVRGTPSVLNAALNNLVFTPDTGFQGPAQLRLELNDLGNGGARPAATATSTVAVTVLPVNVQPVVSAQTITVGHTPVAGEIIGTVTATNPNPNLIRTFFTSLGTLSDDEDDSLPVAIDPQTGQLTVINPDLLIEKSGGYVNVKAKYLNQSLTSLSAHIIINVVPGNQRPTAWGETYSVNSDASVTGNVLTDNQGGNVDSDPDGNTLSVRSATDSAGNPLALGVPVVLPSGATLTLNPNGSFTYNAATSDKFARLTAGSQDSFTYVNQDQWGATSLSATENLIVNGVNYVQSVANQSFAVDSTAGANTKVGTILVSNRESGTTAYPGEGLQYQITSGNTNNAFRLDQNTGEIYVNDASQLSNGQTYGLHVAVSDSGNHSPVPAIITITVTPTQLLVISTPSYLTPEGVPLTGNLLLDDTGHGVPQDPNVGYSLHVVAVNGRVLDVGRMVTLSSGAVVQVNGDGSFSYDPTKSSIFNALGLGQTGTETIPVKVRDGFAADVDTNLVIRVLGRNAPPVARDNSYAVVGTGIYTGNVIADRGPAEPDSDPDTGDALQVVLVNNATVSATAGTSVTTFGGATLVMNADGSFQYDPSTIPLLAQQVAGASQNGWAVFKLDDWFTYAVKDNHGSGPATATAHIALSILPDDARLGVTNLHLMHDNGTAVTGPQGTDPKVAGTLVIQGTPVDHYIVQFAVNVQTDNQGNLIEPQTADGETTISPTTAPDWKNFSFDPGSSNSFSTAVGTKTIAYRVESFNSGSTLLDTSSWNYFTFQLQQASNQGPVRFVDGPRLYNDTGPINVTQPGQTSSNSDNSTTDPTLYLKVNGDFTGHTVRVDFSYNDGTAHNDSVPVPGSNQDVRYDPRTNNTGLKHIAAAINNFTISYHLVTVTNGSETVVASGTVPAFTLNPPPTVTASIAIFREVPSSQPGYFGTTRVVQGTVASTSTLENADAVYVQFQYADVNGQFLDDNRFDGETEAVRDSTSQSPSGLTFQYTAVGLLAVAPIMRARVRQWMTADGVWAYGPWTSPPLQLSTAKAPSIATMSQVPYQDGVRTPPTVTGSLVGAETTNGQSAPHDLSSVAYVTVQFFAAAGQITADTPIDGTAITDSQGNFTYTMHTVPSYQTQYGTMFGTTLQAQTVVTLPGTSTDLHGEFASTYMQVAPANIPSLAQDNFGFVTPAGPDIIDNKLATEDPRVTGTLTLSGPPAVGFQDVRIQFAQDDGTHSDAQTTVVGSTTPDADGKFTYVPAGMPLGDARIRARVAYFDPILNIPYYGSWVDLSFYLKPRTNKSNSVADLQLVNATVHTDGSQHTTDPTITGHVDDPEGYTAFVGVHFREVGTTTVLGTATTDAQGNFTYTLAGLSTGSHTIEAQAQEWDYVRRLLVWGPWTSGTTNLAFTLDAKQALHVTNLQLQSATGTTVGGVPATANPLLVGKIEGDDSVANVRIAINIDSTLVATVTTDADGYFSYLPVALSYSTHTVSAVIAATNSGSSTYQFKLELESATPIALGPWDLANPPVGGAAVTDPTLTGTIVSQSTVQGVTIEFDYDNNDSNPVNGSATTDAYGRFTFVPPLLPTGTTVIRARVHEDNKIPGSWDAHPKTINYQPAHYQPVITSFAPAGYDSNTPPHITENQFGGYVTTDGQAVTAEFSWSNTEWKTVGTAAVDNYLHFSFAAPGLISGQTYTLWARVKEASATSPTGYVYSDSVSTTFQYAPSTSGSVSIASLHLLHDTGTDHDGATSDGRISGTVSGFSPLGSVSVYVELDGDQNGTTILTTDSSGAFVSNSGANSSLTRGFHSLRVWAYNGSLITSVRALNFVFDSSEDNAQTLALVRAFTTADPLWQSDGSFSSTIANATADAAYQSSLDNADADHTYQVATAELTRQGAEKTADDTYNQLKLAAQAAYDAAMATARTNYNSTLATLPTGNQKTFTLNDFVWPTAPDDNALVMPADSDQPAPPITLMLEGPSFDPTLDPWYQSQVASAEQTYQTAVQAAQTAYDNNVIGVENTYKTAVQTAQQTYRNEVKAAQDDYDGPHDDDPEFDQTEFQSLVGNINDAWQNYDNAVAANDAAYNAVLSGAVAAKAASLKETEDEEQHALEEALDEWINADKSTDEKSVDADNELAQRRYDIRKDYAPKYQEILDKFSETVEPALKECTKANADAWKAALDTIYPIEAQMAEVTRNYQHDALAARLDHQHDYTEGLAEAREHLAENLDKAVADRDKGIADKALDRDRLIADGQQTKDNAIAEDKLEATTYWAAQLDDARWGQYQIDLATDAKTYETSLANLAHTRDYDKANAVHFASTTLANGEQNRDDAIAQADETRTVNLDEDAVAFQKKADEAYRSRDIAVSAAWFNHLQELAAAATTESKASAGAQEIYNLGSAKASDAYITVEPPWWFDYYDTHGWADNLNLERIGDHGNVESYVDIDNSQTRADAYDAFTKATNTLGLNLSLANLDLTEAYENSVIDSNTAYLKASNQQFHDVAHKVAGLSASYQIDVAQEQDAYNVDVASAAAGYAGAIATAQAGQNYQDVEADGNFDSGEAALSKTQNVDDATAKQTFEENQVVAYQGALESWAGSTPTPWQNYQLALAANELDHVTNLGNADIQHAGNLGSANVIWTNSSQAADIEYAEIIYGGEEGGGAYVARATTIADSLVTSVEGKAAENFVTDEANAVRDHDQGVADANLTLDDALADANAARDHAVNRITHAYGRTIAGIYHDLSLDADTRYQKENAALQPEYKDIAAEEQKRTIAAAQAQDDWTHEVTDLNVALVEDEVAAQHNRAGAESNEKIILATAVADAERDYKDVDALASKTQTLELAHADFVYDRSTASYDATYALATSDAAGDKSIADAAALGNYEVNSYQEHYNEAAANYTASSLALYQKDVAAADFAWAESERAIRNAYQLAVNRDSHSSTPGIEAMRVIAINTADVAQTARSSQATFNHDSVQAEIDRVQAVALAAADSKLYLAQKAAEAGETVQAADDQGKADIAMARATAARDVAYADADLAWVQTTAPAFAAYSAAYNGLWAPFNPDYQQAVSAANKVRDKAEEAANDKYDQAVADAKADESLDLNETRGEYVTDADEANLEHVQETNEANGTAAVDSTQNDMHLTVLLAQSDEVHQDQLLVADYNHSQALDAEDVLLAKGMNGSLSYASLSDLQNTPDVVRATARAAAEANYANRQAYDEKTQWQSLATTTTDDQVQFQAAASAARYTWINNMQTAYVTYSQKVAEAANQSEIKLAVAQANQDTGEAGATMVYGLRVAADDRAHTLLQAQADNDDSLYALGNQNASTLAVAQANNERTEAYAEAQSRYDEAKAKIDSDKSLSSTQQAQDYKDIAYELASAKADADLMWRSETSEAEYNFAAADWVAETVANNVEREAEAGAAADLESAEKSAQVAAMGTLVTQMSGLPWAQYEADLATAAQAAWNDVKNDYSAWQSNISVAYYDYTQARAADYVASATRIAQDQQHFAEESAGYVVSEVNQDATIERDFSLDLADLTTAFRQQMADAQHAYDESQAAYTIYGTYFDSSTLYYAQQAAHKQFTSGYAARDTSRREDIAAAGDDLTESTAGRYQYYAGDMTGAEAEFDNQVAAADYDPADASNSTALENRLARFQYNYLVGEGAARVTRLNALATSSGTPWAVLAAAAESNSQTIFVVGLGGNEKTRELTYASAENQYRHDVDAADRAQQAAQVGADVARAEMQAALALAQAAFGADDVDPPADFTLPSYDIGNVVIESNSYSVSQPGGVTDSWYHWGGLYVDIHGYIYNQYGFGTWLPWASNGYSSYFGAPWGVANYIGYIGSFGTPWQYAWGGYGIAGYGAVNPWAYFAGAYYGDYGAFAGGYGFYYGGWNYAGYGWGWGGPNGWYPNYGASPPQSLTPHTSIDVPKALNDFDTTLANVEGRVDNVANVMTAPQDQTPAVIDPATGAVQVALVCPCRRPLWNSR